MSFDKRKMYDLLPEFMKDTFGCILREIPRFNWRPTLEERIYLQQFKEAEHE